MGLSSNSASSIGSLWNQLNISFGYIVLNTLLIIAYVNYRDIKNKTIEDQKENNKNLLRIISHDISNQLAVVKLGTKVFLNKNKGYDLNNVSILQSNLNAVENIRELIDHTRKMEALDSGKLEINFGRIDLIDVLEKSFDTFKLKASDKGIEYLLDKPTEKLLVLGDKICLENQVFNNLLSNAIKFTPKGKKVSVKVQHDQNNIRVIFEDSGIGIIKSALPNIFSHTGKTSTFGTEGEKGTGFGLPIVKSIMDRMKAEINVTSQHQDQFPNSHGTKFILSFKKVN